MAEVDGIVIKRPTGSVGRVVGTADLTGATSTLSQVTHQFRQILYKVLINVRGTNTMTYTVSGVSVTITGTNNDKVDFDIEGF